MEQFSIEMADRVREIIETAYGAGNVELLQSDYVGPRFSADLAQQTFMLASLAILLILIYLWFRFRFNYALSAVIATMHDALFMVAFIGALQLEVSTATIAAVLTIVGYSLNDTIVIFDRIRENTTLMRESSYEDIVNASISQSMSRTIITSLTTLLAVLAIWLFASGQVQLFAANLIVGIVVGTYSTIFIASPMSLILFNAGEKRRRDRDTRAYGHAAAGSRKELAPAKSQEKRSAPPAPSAGDGSEPVEKEVRTGAGSAGTGSRGTGSRKKKKKK